MRTVPYRGLAVIVLAAACLPVVAVLAQSSANSPLMVQVNPEAVLDTPVATLSFTVDNPGQIATSRPVAVTALVRDLPSQQIHLTAQPAALSGPAGPVTSAAIRWSGAMTTATGGAAAAVCTSGDFSAGGPHQMIANWTQSGIATCTITFGLVTDAGWPAGTYTGVIDLSLSAQ